VCYVDPDPVVLAHAQALLADETTIAMAGDLRDPEAILADPGVRAHLALTRPVAVPQVAVPHFLTPQDDLSAVVASLRDALAQGSCLVVSYVTDLPDEPRLEGVPAVGSTVEDSSGVADLGWPVFIRWVDSVRAARYAWAVPCAHSTGLPEDGDLTDVPRAVVRAATSVGLLAPDPHGGATGEARLLRLGALPVGAS
jgi:hypothetical protein